MYLQRSAFAILAFVATTFASKLVPRAHADLEKALAAPRPVLSLGDPSNYIPTGTQVPHITQTGLDVVLETGNAGDAFLILSPDLQTQVQTALEQGCKSSHGSDCEDALMAVLHKPSVDLQARAFGIDDLAVIAIVAGVAIIVENWRLNHQPAPSVLRFASSDLVQISAVASATTGPVIVNEGSITEMITIAPAGPTSATGATPQVLTLTSSRDGHGVGDVLLTLPPDLASRAQEIIQRSSTCPAYRKRALDLDCVIGGAENLILNAQVGGPLHDLLLVQGRFPQFAAADVLRAMNVAMDFARNNAPALAADTETAANFGAMAFAMAFDVLIDHISLAAQNYFAASELVSGTTTDRQATTSQTLTGCPSYTHFICQDKTCSGDIKTKTCVTGQYSGCKCTNEGPPGTPAYYDTSFGNAQASYFQSMQIALATATPTPSCFVNSAGLDFTGGVAASPATWCVCTQTADPFVSVSYSTGIYSTIPTASPSAVCAYMRMPMQTISVSFQQPATTGRPTSCNIVTTMYTSVASNVGVSTNVPYSSCTCNDNFGWGVLTTSLGDQTSYYCPDRTPILTPTTTSSAPPTDSPTEAVVIIRDTWSTTGGFLVLPENGVIFGMHVGPPADYRNSDRCKWYDITFTAKDNNAPVTPNPLDTTGDLKQCTYTAHGQDQTEGGVLSCEGIRDISCYGFDVGKAPAGPGSKGHSCDSSFQDIGRLDFLQVMALCLVRPSDRT